MFDDPVVAVVPIVLVLMLGVATSGIDAAKAEAAARAWAAAVHIEPVGVTCQSSHLFYTYCTVSARRADGSFDILALTCDERSCHVYRP